MCRRFCLCYVRVTEENCLKKVWSDSNFIGSVSGEFSFLFYSFMHVGCMERIDSGSVGPEKTSCSSTLAEGNTTNWERLRWYIVLRVRKYVNIPPWKERNH